MEALREIICCKRIYFFLTNGIIEVCAAALYEEAESSFLSHWARHSIWFSLRKASKRTLKVTGKCWTWSGLPCWHQWATTEHPIPDQKPASQCESHHFMISLKHQMKANITDFRPINVHWLSLAVSGLGLKPQPSPMEELYRRCDWPTPSGLTYWQQLDLPTQQKKLTQMVHILNSKFARICQYSYIYIYINYITCQNVCQLEAHAVFAMELLELD